MSLDLQTSAPLPRQTWNIHANPLSSLTEKERALAQTRFVVLQPHLHEDVPLIHIAQETGWPERTLRRWLACYRKQGLAGLVCRPRSDRGVFRLSEDLRRLIEGLALQKSRPSARSVYRRVQRIAGDRNWPVPSYRTVAAVIQCLSPALLTLAHEGVKAYSQAFDLLYRREADRPNEIWQADHTPLDIWVFDERGEPARPWFTVILDDHSRAVAGWRLSFQAPSAFQTALTLRQAIWRKEDPRWHVCGIPEILYTDHGSDFTSHHLEQVAIDLNIRPIFSTVGEPRGRGRIERFFESVNQLFLQDQPGYTPPKAEPAKPSLTIAELEGRMESFLLDDYHQRIHPETGCAPQARWEAGGFLPRMAESLEQLDLLLLTVASSRIVQRDGIHFQTLRYLDTTLAAYIGEAVTIRYDPRDLAEIRVFYHDHFLCRAICQGLAGQEISLKEIIQARRARRRELREQIKSRTRVVDILLEAKAGGSPPLPLEIAPRSSRLKRYVHDDE